jgi:DNA-binding IclR family transcriptional regulator
MSEPSQEIATGGIKSVETSIAVIEVLQQLGEARVTEIADRIGISKGAVYKHLLTLLQNDFVTKDGDFYRLGFRFLDIGGELRFNYPGANLIKPKIKELAHKTDEVGLFVIKEGDRAVTLFRENSDNGVFTRTRLGKRLFLHQTAGGKAILSQLSDSEVRRIIDSTGLSEATENTITDEDELFQELEEIQEQGYARNMAESTSGVIGIAVPLVADEKVIGACSVAGPRHRLEGDRFSHEIPETLFSIVNELELNITHSRSG